MSFSSSSASGPNVLASRFVKFWLAILTGILMASAAGCASPSKVVDSATKGAAKVASAVTSGAAAAVRQPSHTYVNKAGYVINCYGDTCSLYLSKADTQRLNQNITLAGGGVSGLAGSCALFSLMGGPAGAIVGVACGAAIGLYGSLMLNAVTHAANDNSCLRVGFVAVVASIPGTGIHLHAPASPGLTFSTDNSGYCH